MTCTRKLRQRVNFVNSHFQSVPNASSVLQTSQYTLYTSQKNCLLTSLATKFLSQPIYLILYRLFSLMDSLVFLFLLLMVDLLLCLLNMTALLLQIFKTSSRYTYHITCKPCLLICYTILMFVGLDKACNGTGLLLPFSFEIRSALCVPCMVLQLIMQWGVCTHTHTPPYFSSN